MGRSTRPGMGYGVWGVWGGLQGQEVGRGGGTRVQGQVVGWGGGMRVQGQEVHARAWACSDTGQCLHGQGTSLL